MTGIDLKFPDRSIPRTADVGKRKAGAGLTTVAFDLEPAKAAIAALGDRRRWLGRSAIAFHPDRTGFGLGAVGLIARRRGTSSGIPGVLRGVYAAYHHRIFRCLAPVFGGRLRFDHLDSIAFLALWIRAVCFSSAS